MILGRFHQLERHRQARRPAAGALGLAGTKPHGCERALDRIAGPQVLAVFGREVVEGQQLLPVLQQAFDR